MRRPFICTASVSSASRHTGAKRCPVRSSRIFNANRSVIPASEKKKTTPANSIMALFYRQSLKSDNLDFFAKFLRRLIDEVSDRTRWVLHKGLIKERTLFDKVLEFPVERFLPRILLHVLDFFFKNRSRRGGVGIGHVFFVFPNR